MTAEPGTDQGERWHARPVLLVRAYELVLTGVAIVWLALPKRGSAVALLATSLRSRWSSSWDGPARPGLAHRGPKVGEHGEDASVVIR